MPNPVVHFEIIGSNRHLLGHFCKRVFDWQIGPVMERYSIVNTGSGIAGGTGAIAEPRRCVTFYVEVAQIEASLVTIESQGGKKAFGPHSLPTGAIFADFTDPEGQLEGLWQQPKWNMVPGRSTRNR